MADTIKKSNEKEQNIATFNVNDMLEFKWFFDSFNPTIRQEIFETIFNYLFKENESGTIQYSPKEITDYIKAKDYRYYNKTSDKIISSFKKNKDEINESLKKFQIRLIIEDKSYLYLEDFDKKNFIQIRCLRYVRFEDLYEWICSPLYLLYFEYFVLKYKKPSRLQIIDLKEEIEEEEKEEGKEKEEDIKVYTIDSISKAEEILQNENFIYIEDSKIQNIDYKKIFEKGNQRFIFTKENILEYLDYSINDPKHIKDNNIIYNNTYEKVLDFSFEPHFDNLIYSFHNGNYFFEEYLMNCLNSYIKKKYQFFYLNFKKINKIFNNKYEFKKYLAFWLTKLIPEKIEDEQRFYDFVENLINLVIKNKENFLEIIINKLNEAFSKTNNNYDDNNITITSRRILIILNNINLSYIKLIEESNFLNLNFLFIINIQDNFDAFKKFFYEEKRLKKFFLEMEDEIAYKDSNIENDEDYYYYLPFQSQNEYETSAKELINKVFNGFKTNKDKLLNLSFILNISEYITRFNNIDSFSKLKRNLGIFNDILNLKPFFPLINLYISVKDNTNFNLDGIKFKEIYIYNQLKELYLFYIINYLNQNSSEFFLDDIKGPLLEKDIILSILTGQIKTEKYRNFGGFKEVKVKSIFCLNKDKLEKYEDNSEKNIVITQESKTAELYDFAFKIDNYMKFGQISIFKDINDLEKLIKEAIILDLINFDSNKDELKLGRVDKYSFSLITSINVYNEYSKLEKDKKEKHTFFLMKEHCKKNDLEFYIYNYFENKMYRYNEDSDNIDMIGNFFNIEKKISFFDKNLQIYKFIASSKRKISLRSTKNDLLKPFKAYYQPNQETEISFINLAKYEFNDLMLKMHTGINNIGVTLWKYSSNKRIDYLQINLNNEIKYFKGNKIIKNKPDIFNKTNESEFHAILFLLREEKKEKEKEKKEFINKKRRNPDAKKNEE